MRRPIKARAGSPSDHRSRVARERRERTRARILEAALRVFAAKGADAPVIGDFIEAAGVARGTFYNYFDSVPELLEATTQWLEEDLMASIERELEGLADPVDRLTTGVRLWLHQAEVDALWCAFVARAVTHGDVVEATLARDLRDGLASGGFTFGSVRAARDLVVGTLHEAMRSMAQGPVPARFTEDVARVVFRGLGMPARKIDSVLRRPLPAFRRDRRRVE